MRLLKAIAIYLSILSTSGFAQQGSDAIITKWNFSFTSGAIFGGPCKPTQESLLNNGIGTDWDVYTKNYSPLFLEANYGINKYLRLGLSFSNLHQDLVYHHNGIIAYHFNTRYINPIIYFNFRNLAFFGAGPSLNVISYLHPLSTSPWGFVDGNDFAKLGFTVKSSLEVPTNNRIYLRLDMQYNFGSKIDPLYSVVGSGGLWRGATPVHLSEFPVNWFYSGIGLGLRFRGNISSAGNSKTVNYGDYKALGSKRKFELAVGAGFPIYFNAGIRYGKIIQVGAFIGIKESYYFNDNNNAPTISAELYYHFSGISKFSDQPPWYCSGTFCFWEPVIYYGPKIGRTFNLSERTGINLDLGYFRSNGITRDLKDEVHNYTSFAGSLNLFIRF